MLVARLKREFDHGRTPVTHGGVVGQVWRGGSGRQARLSQALQAIEVAPLDDNLGRRAGMLLASSRGSDVIDAAVIALAADGDSILTSDPRDLTALAEAADLHVDIVPV